MSGEPFRAIAALELFATLIGVVLFKPRACENGRISISAGTDNLGNTHVVSRLMTPSSPLSAMELSAVMIRENLDLSLDWLPRLQNVEADSLTNEAFGDFSPDLRLRFEFDSYESVVLKNMLNCWIWAWSYMLKLEKRTKTRCCGRRPRCMTPCASETPDSEAVDPRVQVNSVETSLGLAVSQQHGSHAVGSQTSAPMLGCTWQTTRHVGLGTCCCQCYCYFAWAYAMPMLQF